MNLRGKLLRQLPERKELPGYVILFFLVSIPIFNDYLFRGHDIYFHLMRIEGLAEGLRTGQFPVKIQPEWFGGYGYAVSVFYGDLLLFPVAILRMLGMSLQNAYKAYVLLCNAGTIAVAGYVFTKIFANRYIGLLGSTLYSFAVYRLMNVYVRASLGEYTGMMFMPLIMYSCVLLFNRDKDKNQIRKGSYLLGISMAVVVQSHILTCEMVCVMLVLVLVLNIRRVFDRTVLVAGVKAVGIALGLSLGFLIPFVDYMINMNMQVNAEKDVLAASIQRQGAFWKQHFEIFGSTQGASLDISEGTVGEFSIGIGLVLCLAVVAFVIVAIIIREKMCKKEWRIATVSALLGMLALWMTTCEFPWNRLANHAGPFRSLIASIQFPWRFSSVATLCMVLLWCAVIKIILDRYGKKLSVIVSCAVVMLLMISATYFISDLYMNREKIQIDSIADMDSYVWSGNEYLAVDVNLDELKEKTPFENDKLEVNNYSRSGTKIEFYCENNTDTVQSLEVPLLFYKGYQAAGKSNDQITFDIPVSAGENGLVHLTIPAESNLDIQVKFVEPVIWRIAEVISILVFIGLAIKLITVCKSKHIVVS